MKRCLFVLASLAATLACWVTPAQGQAPSGDSVSGTVREPALPTFLVTWTFNAASGPQGENPTGTVDNEFFGTGDVTCLNVQGNRAVIGVFFPRTGLNFLIDVVDSDVPDTIGYDGISGPPITVCPPPGGQEVRSIFSGNLTVVDGQALPTSIRDCLGGGWRDFGFSRVGACIRFVVLTRICEALERKGHRPHFCPPTPPRST